LSDRPGRYGRRERGCVSCDRPSTDAR
jgi:hypothetical protein